MKHYERLIEMGCFSRSDLTTLTGSEAAANSLIYSYKQKGLISAVRRDLFVTISLETKQPIPNRYVVGSHIAPDACVSHHSAFEYYGYANQVYYDVYVTTASRFREFEFDGCTYRHVPLTYSYGIEKQRDTARVTSIERTVVDSIGNLEKNGGLEELLRCVDMIPRLDGGKLLASLNRRGCGFLMQKTGYILEHYKEDLLLPDSFFEACIAGLPGGKRYLYQGLQNEPHVLNKKWRLFAPPDLTAVTSQGETELYGI
ncbi:MAG: transcriptional regulator [Oscillospiraceae bacterium]|jgi:predicted transcriptional regulator of viral defense system|nr:transcriptional regulator [Oscillospiraceae bacterium]